MGDDTVIIVPTEPEPEKEVQEETALLTRIVELAREVGECNARIADFEIRLAELGSREWASVEHSHEGLATAEHTHDGYAPTEHSHETPTPKEREPDKPPEKQHPYFRKLSDF